MLIEIISRSISDIKKHFFVLLGLGVISGALGSLRLSYSGNYLFFSLPISLFSTIFHLTLPFFIVFLLIHPAPLLESIENFKQVVKDRWRLVIKVHLLMMLYCLIGVTLFVIPGMILFAGFSLVWIAVLVEDKTINTLNLSKALVKKGWLVLLSFYIALMAPFFIVLPHLIKYPHAHLISYTFFASILGTVITPIHLNLYKVIRNRYFDTIPTEKLHEPYPSRGRMLRLLGILFLIVVVWIGIIYFVKVL